MDNFKWAAIWGGATLSVFGAGMFTSAAFLGTGDGEPGANLHAAATILTSSAGSLFGIGAIIALFTST